MNGNVGVGSVVSSSSSRLKLRAVLPHGRRRSERAAAALEAFGAIRRFFPSDALLAEALGWDLATVAAWRAGGVVRPQAAKVAQVLLLNELCEEARAYLDADSDVARWITSPQPYLAVPGKKGATPALYLRTHNTDGLDQISRGLVQWMPSIEEQNLEEVPVDEQPRSDAPGAKELDRMLGARD